MVRDEKVRGTVRKPYSKPQVFRVRLVAAEAVLSACKTANGSHTGGATGTSIPCNVAAFGCVGPGS